MATVRDWLRAAMARGRKGDTWSTDKSEEGPVLSKKQRAGVERGVDVVARYGGVVLADAVGLGKTRVAVAMAKRIVAGVRRRTGKTKPALFCVPARLRQNWRRAIADIGWQLGRDAVVISHHRLSRQPFEERPPVVIVDEAHRFRTPSAKRSQHLAKITSRSPPILVTATPVCTRRRDLFVLLSYFLSDAIVKSMVGMGLEAAFEADEVGEFDIIEILEEVVIRRRRPDFGAAGRPAVAFEILGYRASDDEAWLWRNLEPELRNLCFSATGEHWPRGLLINNLLRMWESGPEALWQSLDELLHFHERWLEAAEAGRQVERPDFRALFGGVHRSQQVFSFLYAKQGGQVVDEGRRRGVEEDVEILEKLAGRVDSIRQSKAGMTAAIVEKVGEIDDEKFVIFAAYLAAARALFSALAGAGRQFRVGLVTGEDARATGLGQTTDREVLDRFMADTSTGGERHRRLRILVATDCLAEGINLQGCSQMILADLPYSPVKLEQRIGRIARPGSTVEKVTVYLPRPASWTDSLGMRRRLGERLEMAQGFGAGLAIAEATGFGDDEAVDRRDKDSSGPLAAMTLEQKLWSQIASTAGDESPRFAKVGERADGAGKKGEALWLRVRIDSGLCRRIWLEFSGQSEKPQVKLSEQLRGLAYLADDRRAVQRWKPSGRLWERAKSWLQARKSQLEAARLAPPMVGAGSEPVKMWRLLQRAAQRGEISADADKLDRWRRRLVHAHPPGIRYEMAQCLEGEPSARQMVRFVDGLAAPVDTGPVSVEVVAGLKVCSSL